jgi:GIY-YIG catalytic domain
MDDLALIVVDMIRSALAWEKVNGVQGESMITFEQIIAQMPVLLEKLNKQPIFKKDEITMQTTSIPIKGIYVLFDDGKPIYVGRSNKIKQRLNQHANQGSDRYSATFAFRLAIKDYENKYSKSTKGIPRIDLEKHPDFKVIFSEARAKVSKMGIKAVEIDDPLVQTIFEVYAAMKLGTLEFNSFENH